MVRSSLTLHLQELSLKPIVMDGCKEPDNMKVEELPKTYG
jgi:hypothetical protein